MPESTIYDRVLKTEAHDRKSLIIPLVNELYRELYKGQEEIEFLEGEHYIRNAKGEIEKRATDCYLKVKDTQEEKYSSVVFLRHTRNTPDNLEIVIGMKDGTIMQSIPVMKLQNYTLDELFEKNLLILIPFHIFVAKHPENLPVADLEVYENRFMVYNENTEQLEEFKQVYKRIAAHLHMLVEDGTIDGYDAYLIASMTVKVAEHLAKEYENVVKGVKEAVMDDGYIDYPGRKEYLAAREEGRVEGRMEGRTEGILHTYISLIKDGIISLAEAAKRLQMSEDKMKTYL